MLPTLYDHGYSETTPQPSNGINGIATRDVGGQARLSINGKQVAKGRFAHLRNEVVGKASLGCRILDIGSARSSLVGRVAQLTWVAKRFAWEEDAKGTMRRARNGA